MSVLMRTLFDYARIQFRGLGYTGLVKAIL